MTNILDVGHILASLILGLLLFPFYTGWNMLSKSYEIGDRFFNVLWGFALKQNKKYKNEV